MARKVTATDTLLTKSSGKLEIKDCNAALVKNIGDTIAVIGDHDAVDPGDYKEYPYFQDCIYNQEESVTFSGTGSSRLMVTYYKIEEVNTCTP